MRIHHFVSFDKLHSGVTSRDVACVGHLGKRACAQKYAKLDVVAHMHFGYRNGYRCRRLVRATFAESTAISQYMLRLSFK